MRKFIFVRTEFFSFCTAQNFRSNGRKFFFGRRPNFLPQENLFPCGRKNIFLRKEIFFCAHGNFAPSAEPFFPLEKEGNSEGEGAFFGRGEGEDFLGEFGRLGAEEISLQCDYLWKVVAFALHR